MVAFSFSTEFVDAVSSGRKSQTIRQRKRAKPGDRLQLYTGMRTKNCRKIVANDPVCTLVDYVSIRPDYLTLGDTRKHEGDADDFARRDGFENYAAMVKWFETKYGSPYFQGFVHVWKPAE